MVKITSNKLYVGVLCVSYNIYFGTIAIQARNRPKCMLLVFFDVYYFFSLKSHSNGVMSNKYANKYSKYAPKVS